LPQVEIIDPAHPLFGHRFPLLRERRLGGGQSHVLVVYKRKGVYLRLPIAATDLAPAPRRAPPASKLNAQAVTELITLAEQYCLLCPSPPQLSGGTSAPNADKPS
jgi:hypothetical protein